MKFLKLNDSGLGGTQLGLMAVAIVIFSVAVLYTVVPSVGSKIEQASPITGDCSDSSTAAAPAAWNCSSWNTTYNSGMPTGYSFWGANANLLTVAGLILIIAVILGYLMFIR